MYSSNFIKIFKQKSHLLGKFALTFKQGWFYYLDWGVLWTSIKEQIKRWEKLIGASVIRAYKNAQHSKGMVCKWEIGQEEW